MLKKLKHVSENPKHLQKNLKHVSKNRKHASKKSEAIASRNLKHAPFHPIFFTPCSPHFTRPQPSLNALNYFPTLPTSPPFPHP